MAGKMRMDRRRFLLAGSGAVGAMYLPCLIPRRAFGANDRIGIGVIGTGRRAHQMLGDLRGLPSLPGEVQVVATSDIWPKKCGEWIEAFEKDVLRKKGVESSPEIDVQPDYRELLARKDVDGVMITTCDHWHALPAIHACQAGKDVYGEKPLSLTVAEGRAMVSAVRKYKRVFQTGTQQRSYLRNRQGCELVRNGRLGKIKEVRCTNYASSKPISEYDIPVESVPEGLDWDRWCGQTEPRDFSTHIYLTYNDPGWQRIREYSGGLMTNWGAHGLDMVQWALGMDDTGPVVFEPSGNKPDSPITFTYANGISVIFEYGDSRVLGGGHFMGERGELVMNRGKFNTIPIAISKEELTDDDLRLYKSDHHLQNWVDCMRTREKPVADVEIGHRTASLCHICGIARRLGRKLRWDPEKEVFPGDDEANLHLDRPKRKPFELPDSV